MYGETKKGRMVGVEQSLWERVIAAAKAERLSLSAWVREAIRLKLDSVN